MWPLAKLCAGERGHKTVREVEAYTQCRAMKFSNVIPRKIVKIVATRGQILRRKCTTGGAYSAPQTS